MPLSVRGRIRLLTALFAGVIATGCQPEPGALAPLRIAFVPQVDMEERHASAYQALHTYLSGRLDQPVEIIALENANAALEGMRSGKLDVCNFSPWPFLLAEEKAGLEALLTTRAPDGGPVTYRGILVSRPALGIASLDDLKAQAPGLVFAFEEPVSTSGHLVPRTYLHAAGIAPERDFKRVIYGSDGIANLFAVASGRVDVAALSDNSYRRALARGRIVEGAVNVVWTSPPVISHVVATRRMLSAATKERLRALYVGLPTAAPDLWAEVARQYSTPVGGYAALDDDALAFFRHAIRDVPGLQLSP